MPGISTPSKQMIDEDVVTDAVAEVEVVEEVEVEEEFEADPPGVFLFDVTALESIELRSGVASSGFDVISFERNLKASISMGEICRTMRERYLSSSF